MSRPKIIAYMPLHYGATYLKESLLSVIDLVEKIVILYSPLPSYGFGTDAVCPDTEAELKQIAELACEKKLIWETRQFGNEGEHRAFIYNYTKKYDICLAVDADEVMHTEELKKAIEVAYNGDKRYYGIGRNADGTGGYINFWRSFEWKCQDGFCPVRITNLKNKNGQGVVNCTIYHFSCAQSEETMRYKLLIHGHRDEIRPNWLEDIYFAWTPGSIVEHGLHLVAYDIWVAEPFDKFSLPISLHSHPNFTKEII